MNQAFIESRIEELKKEKEFRDLKDHHLFTCVCLKYFYFNSATNPFVPDTIKSYVTDKSRDGGIDAIFNDPNSEDSDVIVVQSKYYKSTDITQENVAGELYKIGETLRDLRNNKIEGYNEQLVTAYRYATSQMEDNGVIKVVFFSSYEPKNKGNYIQCSTPYTGDSAGGCLKPPAYFKNLTIAF